MSSEPNIIWVTLESTRADATSVGEGSTDNTPNLRRIAADSNATAASYCFAHGIWTLPSSASILTGTYPTCHDAGMDSRAIPETLRTIPERLQTAGYTTACISPNSHLSEATGLDRGFDRFAWVGKSTLLETVGLRTLGRYTLNVRKHGGGFTLDSRRHHRGYMLNDLAKRWVRSFEGDDEPYFLYLHHPGPHHPYTPPRRYCAEYLDDVDVDVDTAVDLALDFHDNLFEYIAEGIPLSETELTTIRRLYQAEIAYVDELVGDLFDHVQNHTTEETIFVVTGDHGELFGEDDMLAHMISVSDAVSHVPLIVHGFDFGAGIEGPVQHTDILRTLLSASDIDTEGIHGVDLRESRRDWAVVQRGARRTRQNLAELTELNPKFDTDRYRRSTVTTLRSEDFKYIHSDGDQSLYELPDETTAITADFPERAAMFEDAVESLLAGDAAPFDDDVRDGNFTEAMEAQLADLGYLVE